MESAFQTLEAVKFINSFPKSLDKIIKNHHEAPEILPGKPMHIINPILYIRGRSDSIWSRLRTNGHGKASTPVTVRPLLAPSFKSKTNLPGLCGSRPLNIKQQKKRGFGRCPIRLFIWAAVWTLKNHRSHLLPGCTSS